MKEERMDRGGLQSRTGGLKAHGGTLGILESKKKRCWYQFHLGTAVVMMVVAGSFLGLNLARPTFQVLSADEALQEYQTSGPCIRACFQGWPYYQTVFIRIKEMVTAKANSEGWDWCLSSKRLTIIPNSDGSAPTHYISYNTPGLESGGLIPIHEYPQPQKAVSVVAQYLSPDPWLLMHNISVALVAMATTLILCEWWNRHRVAG